MVECGVGSQSCGTCVPMQLVSSVGRKRTGSVSTVMPTLESCTYGNTCLCSYLSVYILL